jgi:hypothetical protein
MFIFRYGVPYDDVADLAVPADYPMLEVGKIVGVGGLERFRDFLGDQVLLVGMNERLRVHVRRHLVAAFSLRGRAVHGIEPVVEREQGRLRVEFPVHQVGQIHCRLELGLALLEGFFGAFALGHVTGVDDVRGDVASVGEQPALDLDHPPGTIFVAKARLGTVRRVALPLEKLPETLSTGSHVIRVHEVEEAVPHDLIREIPQDRLRGRALKLTDPVRADQCHEVRSVLDESPKTLLALRQPLTRRCAGRARFHPCRPLCWSLGS